MKQASWEEANALAAQCRAAPSEAERLRLTNLLFAQVWELALPAASATALLDETAADGLSRFFEYDWKHFDPAKGSFEHYFRFAFKRRKGDAQGQAMETQKRKKKGEPEGEEDYCIVLSTDAPMGDEQDGGTLGSVLPSRAESPEALAAFDSPMLELLSAVLRLLAAPGKKNNAVRQNYFRLFFTQDISFFLREFRRPDTLERRERELFSVMKLPFLDFTLEDLCRTLLAISRSGLKPYGAMVPGRPDTPPRENGSALPADVYLAYLERGEGTKVGNSTISNQMKSYTELKQAVIAR